MSSLLQATNFPLDKILFASLGLIAFVVIGLLAATQIKKRMQSTDQDPSASMGFTLSDLRELHKSGQVTDEEFERAKGRVIAAAKRAADRNVPKPEKKHREFDGTV